MQPTESHPCHQWLIDHGVAVSSMFMIRQVTWSEQKSNSDNNSPFSFLASLSITSPVEIKSFLASLNQHCCKLSWIVHFDRASSINIWPPVLIRFGCLNRSFFQTDSMLNLLSSLVLKTAAPINLFTSRPFNSPQFLTWHHTSAWVAMTSNKTSGILVGGFLWRAHPNVTFADFSKDSG